MAGDLTKTIKMQIVADDADAQAKLDAISAKADRLAEKNPEIEPKIRDDEFKAKLLVLRGELKEATRPITAEIKAKVDDKSVAESEAKISLLKRLLGITLSTSRPLGSCEDQPTNR